MTDAEVDRYEVKFNAGGLLRGSLSAQMDFWAKALGAGGHTPIAMPEEARESFDWPQIDRSQLPAPPGQHQTGGRNEPA